MKFIITIVFLFLLHPVKAEDFINGAYYIRSAPTNATFAWVGQKQTESQPLRAGHTYSSDKNLFDLETKEYEVSIQLSSGLSVLIATNSEFRVDSFNQMVTVNPEPETLKGGDFILNLSLMNGSAYFIAPKYSSSNTLCVLQTPLMNLELNGGKYYIKVSPKFTIIYIVEGTIGLFDSQTNLKTSENAGEMVLIFPSPLKPTETLTTRKAIASDDMLKISANLQKFSPNASTPGFVVIDGKIIGYRLQ